MTEHRAHFDAEIVFVNGGGLSARDFRLDLPAAASGTPSEERILEEQFSEDRIAQLLIAHLGLALVQSVELSKLRIVEEQHRGSRGVPQSDTEGSTQPEAAAASPRRVVDLSHTIRAGLVTYPGLPAPTITPHLTREESRSHYAPGTEFAMDVLTMIGNTGTYLDSPFHRYEGGADLSGLELAELVGVRAEVLHLTDAASRGIPASVFYDRDVAGAAVLLHTGWDAHFGTPEYATGSPFLSEEGAQYLVEQGAAIVGIDSLNIDDTESGGTRPAHSLLLAAGIHVVEHLTDLGQLPARGARFTAVPPKVEGFGTFPVRAFAEL
ncbi:cyclase family protein [Compostimonas suwonensis]|uniref:Kynurenine formamidase n=1 Tax=Compostimonas suwonensis TaxID=1048394 RepID=A0A2M9BCQ7_9MICO|nr:cyclase family protein [Compostimonas suwonensis]PJJ55723.1 kynurenine formamidase [Compostimonas suwonensis]